MKSVLGVAGAIRFALATVSIGSAGVAATQTTPPATPAPAGAKVNVQLRDELRAILKDDQEGRSQMDAVGKAHGFNSPEMQALWASIAAKDAANLVKVRAILDAHGWIGSDEIGPEANSALFLVIQHSDVSIQQKYLPLLRAAVKEKKAFPNQLALMEDRVALAEGRRQIYGSQLHGDRSNSGRYHVAPMEDPDHVDERRAAMGLEPMAEVLRKHFGLTWDLAAYKRELPGLELDEWGGPPRPGGYDAALLDKIIRIAEADPTGWQRLAAARAKFPAGSKDLREAEDAAQRQDAAKLAGITAILDQRGWVGRALVGRRGNAGIMAVLLSADLPTLKRYLPMVRTAIAAHQADEGIYAMMEDRLALAEGRRQIYGTQFWFDPKTNVPYVALLDQPERVDERRATLGLAPMAEYVKTQRLTWDVAAYQQQLPTIEALGPLVGFGQGK